MTVSLSNIFKSANTKPHKKSPLHKIALTVFLPALVVTGILLIKLSLNFVMDSDPLWSIGVGEWISNHGTVPDVDVFSWTVPGETWFSNSWLFCWLMFLADQSFGYLGIALIVFIPCLATGYFLFIMCKRFHDSTFSIIAFIIGISLLILIAVTPRAYIFTFAFIAIIMYLIRFKIDSRQIYFIPLIILLWVNIQTSMRFGIGIIFVEALVGTIFYKEKKLWPVVILSFLATLLNPYGFSIWHFSLSSFLTPGTQFISEWRSPDFNDLGLLFVYGFMFLSGILGASRLKDDINNKVFDRNKIMILGWFWAALLYSLTTVRALHYVLLLWAPCFAAFATKTPRENSYLKPIILLLVLLLFGASLSQSLPLYSLELDPDSGRPVSFVDYLQINPTLHEKVSLIIPAGAVDYLNQNPEMLENVFNSYIFGGYLLLNNIEVFIDARENVFTRQNVTEDYAAIITLSVKPENIIDKYDINTFLLSKEERLIFYLEVLPEWEKKYQDDVAVIYARSGLD